MRRLSLVIILALTSIQCSYGQVITGAYPFGTFQNLGFENVDLGNLNVSFSIPVLSKPGRGAPFQYNLTYNSSIWEPVAYSGQTSWEPVYDFGWNGVTESLSGYIIGSSTITPVTYKENLPPPTIRYGYCSYTTTTYDYYVGPSGVQHPINNFVRTSKCPAGIGPTPVPSFTETLDDGSGITIEGGELFGKVVFKNGSTVDTAVRTAPPTQTLASTKTDSNGNEISVNSSGQFTDTTGNVVLTFAGSQANSETYTYNDASGNNQVVTVHFSNYTVKTNFGCSGILDYGPETVPLVSSIQMPDNSTYAFSYEPTPGSPQDVTGRLASVTLPTGGTIAYTYSGGNNGINCADGSTAGLTRRLTNDPANSTWAYTRTIGSTTSSTLVQDGMGNQTVYDFVTPVNQSSVPGPTAVYYETDQKSYQGQATGTPLLERQICYDDNSTNCATTQVSLPITRSDISEVLNGGPEKKTTTLYNTYGMPTFVNEYDFGASSPGSLLRREEWEYGQEPEGAIIQTEITYDGSGNIIHETGYGYDQTSVTSSSGVPQHVAVSGPRDNLTSVERYYAADTFYKTQFTYEDTGSVLTATSPTTSSGATTTYSYDPTFEYVTSATLPTPSSGVSMSATATYDESYTGLPTSSTDANGQTTSVASYDEMLRPTQIDYPDGGKTVVVYDSPTQTDIDRYMNASTYADTRITLDGYGRTSVVAVEKDASDWYEVTYCYDADGRLSFKSYPALNQTGCTLPGDTYTYDALGRVTRITHADGIYQSFSYYGRATEWTNEAGNVTRITQVDGLGRPTAVCEVTSNASMPGSGSPANCGLDIAGTGFLTTYAYSNDTTTITQGGQTRIFQTDWLGRPIKTVEPESGTTTYSYALDPTGMVITRTRPKANQTNPSVTTTTTAQYDALGRVVSVSYSDGTPTKAYSYDASAGWGTISQTNLKGRLSIASVPADGNWAGTAFSYDAMGRITSEEVCLPSGCGNGADDKNLSYSYDWLGDVLTESDGAGATRTYSYTQAAQVDQILSSVNDATHPGTLLSNVAYGAFGPVSWHLGNGLNVAQGYNSLGQIDAKSVCNNGSTQIGCGGSGQVYGYTVNWKGQEVLSSTDTVNGDWVYTYDQLGRLATADKNSGQQAFSYVYDRWGNRWEQNVTAGSGPSPQLSFNTSTNQIQMSGYSYDAAGNMTSDGLYTYTYDANGNVIAVDGGNTATYTYGALGHRIRIDQPGSDSEEFVYNANGQPVSSFDVQKGWEWAGWTWWGSQRVAFYADGMTDFDNSDWEGTGRMRTEYNAVVDGSFTSLPFGDGYAVASGEDIDPRHFAMLDQDVNDNDHAMYREYSSMTGRWMSPDPYSGSYNFANPQSFNRYAYVMNSPMSYVDPTGTDVEVCGSNGCYLYTDPEWDWIMGEGPGDGITISGGGEVDCGGTDCGQVYYLTEVPSAGPATEYPYAGNGGRGGVGGGGAGPATTNSAAKASIFLCGSAAASKISLAGGLSHIPGLGSGVGGFIVSAIGGNVFSGAMDLIHSFATGEGGGHSVFYNMGEGVVAGPTQGFGAAFGSAIEDTPWAAGLVDVGTTALVGAEYASGVGELKLLYDGVTYFGATVGCALGIIH